MEEKTILKQEIETLSKEEIEKIEQDKLFVLRKFMPQNKNNKKERV